MTQTLASATLEWEEQLEMPNLPTTPSDSSTEVAPSKSSPSSSEGRYCLEKYKTAEYFLTIYNPSFQERYTRDLKLAYTSDAPTLFAVADAFGEDVAILWLSVQLRDLSEYSNCTTKLTAELEEALSRQIFSDRKTWKVTVLMHFFLLMKGGSYGHFFGYVDTLLIAESLRRFATEKRDLDYKFEKDNKKAEEAADKKRSAAVIRLFKAHLARLGISLQTWLANMDIFMNPDHTERKLPEDEERRLLAQRGIKTLPATKAAR